MRIIGIKHWNAVFELVDNDLIPFLFFPEFYDFSLELFYHLQNIDVAVASQLLYLSLHGLVHSIIFLYFVGKLFIHFLNFLLEICDLLPQF